MTPAEKREFEELKALVQTLYKVENVPFIENAKRRITTPVLLDLGVNEVVSKEGIGSTSGLLKGVTENGVDSYSVAKAYDGSITVRDVNGNSYKLGYYTP